jgi:hypothetical protein
LTYDGGVRRCLVLLFAVVAACTNDFDPFTPRSDASTDGGPRDAQAGDAPVGDGASGRFFVSDPPVSWDQARIACEQAGAHLATITSNPEQVEAAQVGPTRDRWIGLRKTTTQFEWVTGEPVGYTAWGAGEPNEAGTPCARMRTDGTWSDRACGELYPALCER